MWAFIEIDSNQFRQTGLRRSTSEIQSKYITTTIRTFYSQYHWLWALSNNLNSSQVNCRNCSTTTWNRELDSSQEHHLHQSFSEAPVDCLGQILKQYGCLRILPKVGDTAPWNNLRTRWTKDGHAYLASSETKRKITCTQEVSGWSGKWTRRVQLIYEWNNLAQHKVPASDGLSAQIWQLWRG